VAIISGPVLAQNSGLSLFAFPQAFPRRARNKIPSFSHLFPGTIFNAPLAHIGMK
jgi:hypothetical protein